ncbi:MAG: long-chain fatty acid--CoA ligase [Methyloceanibacter sp.]
MTSPYYATAIPHYDWIASYGRRTPDKLATVDLYSNRRRTYREFDNRIGRAALALRHGFGIGRGDRVAVLAPNSIDVFELQFACGRVGAILLPLNWRLTVHELAFIVGDATPKLLIFDRAYVEEATALKARHGVPAVLMLDGGANDSPYEQALAAAAGDLPPIALSHGDVMAILYTSGTTGHPKGAIITYGMTFWNCVNVGMPTRIASDAVTLSVAPLFHTAGLNLFANPCFHAGASVLVMRTFDPGQALDLISDATIGITHFWGVPAHYLFMMQHERFATADFSRLVCACVGGAPAPLSLLEAWTGRGVALQQGYGMTETSPTILVIDAEQAIRKIGSAGLPVLHTEVRLVTVAGSDASPGEIGEIWTRGPNVTPGYWNRPEADASSFTDGWLHTGDAAWQDDDGFYYVVDRWKDMYISGGENVYPAEVENALYELAGVAEAAVIGIPNERLGEVGKAFVVPQVGAELTAAAVLEHCRKRLAKFKMPADVVFIDKLPRTTSGKVLKRELKPQ